MYYSASATTSSPYASLSLEFIDVDGTTGGFDKRSLKICECESKGIDVCQFPVSILFSVEDNQVPSILRNLSGRSCC